MTGCFPEYRTQFHNLWLAVMLFRAKPSACPFVCFQADLTGRSVIQALLHIPGGIRISFS
jgi:hypothetical protein